MISYTPSTLSDNSPLARYIQQELTRLADTIQNNQSNEPYILASYAVANVPDAAYWEGALIYVSDEAGGATVALSDGTDWRRVQDRAIVS